MRRDAIVREFRQSHEKGWDGRSQASLWSYRKDSIKKIKSLIREQYASPSLDGRDIVTFLVNKNYTE